MTTTTNPMTWTESRPRAGAGILRRALATHGDWGATLARVALGLVMLPHGAQKLLGWFAGYGWSGTMGFLTGAVGLPWPVAALVILLESVGGLLLIAGAGGRLMAAGIAAIMAGAVATVHHAHGFFMNWSGAQGGEGFEYHLLAIALALVVMVRGSGAASVDKAIASRLS